MDLKVGDTFQALVEQKHIDHAVASVGNICHVCIIAQLLMGLGFENPRVYTLVAIGPGYKLGIDQCGQQYTKALQRNWDKCEPRHVVTFTVIP